jgi:hypothetical protein
MSRKGYARLQGAWAGSAFWLHSLVVKNTNEQVEVSLSNSLFPAERRRDCARGRVGLMDRRHTNETGLMEADVQHRLDIARLIFDARSAQAVWCETSLRRRLAVITGLRHLIARHASELSQSVGERSAGPRARRWRWRCFPWRMPAVSSSARRKSCWRRSGWAPREGRCGCRALRPKSGANRWASC